MDNTQALIPIAISYRATVGDASSATIPWKHLESHCGQIFKW